MNLNQFLKLRSLVVGLKRSYLRKIWGIDIHPTVELSLSAKFDLTNPKGIHIDSHTYMAFESRILSHDRTRRMHVDTRIGKNCFIGGRSLIMPGVTVGDGCIVGAGSVVTKDVPSGTIVAGNPAKPIHEGVVLGPYGQFDKDKQPSIQEAPPT